MGEITDIVTQKKRDTRACVYLDGKYCCGLEKITILGEGLKIGDEISPEELAEIQRKSEGAVAFDRAVRLLSRRMRTEKEMRVYLAGKGYLPEVVTQVLGKLTEYRYIDDAAFCRAYLTDYGERYGEKKLRTELRRLGADPIAIEGAMEELGDQAETAAVLARKYIRTHAKADRNRIYRFLQTKGYDYDTVKRVLSEIEDEIPPAETEEPYE